MRQFLIGTSILVLAGTRGAQAAEIKIVSPSSYKDREGEGSVSAGSLPPYHYQQVFPAEDFAALENKPHWLLDVTIRPDQSLATPLTIHFPYNELRFSTTQSEPNNMSSRFEDNLGTDAMYLYRGPVTLMAAVNGPGPGPREFYNTDYTAGDPITPFLYDPSQGNLLFDVIARQGLSPSLSEDKTAGLQTGLYGSSASASHGERSSTGVYQFTFVPVTPGDYNHNGTLEAADIDDLTTQTAGGSHPAAYDLNADVLVDEGDIKVWVGELFHSWIGDANLDGQFNSSDLVTVLAAGTYEVDVNSVWSTGDFNGDGRTNSSDLVAALADGGYELGPRAAVSAVPEPASFVMLLVGLIGIAKRRQ